MTTAERKTNLTLADRLAGLATEPATSIKSLGWKKILAKVLVKGRLVVTNHNTPEAVVLSIKEFTTLLDRAAQNDPLVTLKRQFEDRLAVLRTPQAGQRLQAAFTATPEQIAEAADQAQSKAQ